MCSDFSRSRLRSGNCRRTKAFGSRGLGALRALPRRRSSTRYIGLGFRKRPGLSSRISFRDCCRPVKLPRQGNAHLNLEAHRPGLDPAVTRTATLDRRAGPHPLPRGLTSPSIPLVGLTQGLHSDQISAILRQKCCTLRYSQGQFRQTPRYPSASKPLTSNP